MALKGLDYASSLYADPALRPMGDHDLLVREQDFAHAYEALCEVGFKEAVTQTGVATHPQHYAAQLQRDGYSLDLHRAMRQRIRAEVDYEAIFAESQQRSDGLRVAAPPHRAILHCLHMAGHEFCGPLVSYLDLSLMMSNEATGLIARRWRVEHAWRGALRQQARLLGEPLPHAFVGESLLPKLDRLTNPSVRQFRPLQLARKLVLLDDGRHRLAFARYAARALWPRR